MKAYFLLTNRKRAIVALVHTVAFLGIAAMAAGGHVARLGAGSPWWAWMLAGIYFAVGTVLATLARACSHPRERLYFGLCAASAAFGLLRQVAGDPGMHFAVYLRPILLASAIAVGWGILRAHGEAVRPSALTQPD
jgi:hypothetical protein